MLLDILLAPLPKANQSTMPMEEAHPYSVSISMLGATSSLISAGGTNRGVDIQNPSNLGQETTDAGVVPNLKWRFSDSKTRLLKGGWVREQVVQDLPQSRDIAGAQQHLKKGAVRELHWHKVVCEENAHMSRRTVID